MIGSWGNWCECKRPGSDVIGDAIGFFDHENSVPKGKYIIVMWKGDTRPEIIHHKELVFRGAWDPHHWKTERDT